MVRSVHATFVQFGSLAIQALGSLGLLDHTRAHTRTPAQCQAQCLSCVVLCVRVCQVRTLARRWFVVPQVKTPTLPKKILPRSLMPYRCQEPLTRASYNMSDGWRSRVSFVGVFKLEVAS